MNIGNPVFRNYCGVKQALLADCKLHTEAALFRVVAPTEVMKVGKNIDKPRADPHHDAQRKIK